MMKKFSTLESFENASISNTDKKQIKGGHTRVRRPGRTTIVSIWDDVDVRLDGNLIDGKLRGESDLTVRIIKR